MDKQSNHLQPLALPRATVVGEKAFAGDLLGREKLARRLTGYLDRLRVGAVLAIDAPWGEGKTWFGRNWAKHLESEPHKHKVVFIDAFAQDYVEDPFLLIAAEIAAALDDGKGAGKELREKAVGVMKAILPVSAKALINLAGRVALGSANLSDDYQETVDGITGGAADATNKWIEKKLEGHAQEKASLEHFRIELAKFAAAQEKPVVIFIDELDRCRPTFAVQLIERIKHFFDVPNLVFVLLLNREQIESSIKGVYGHETDAATYLGKFVHLFLRLPKNLSRNTDSFGHPTEAFIKDVLNRYGFASTQATLVENLMSDLYQWAVAANMSLRDIERACALFVMSNASRSGLIVYLIVLKIKYPVLYERLVRHDMAAHEEAINLLNPLIQEKNPEEMQWPDFYFKCIQELHRAQLGVVKVNESICLAKYAHKLFGSINSERIFSDSFNRIDLPME